MGAWVAALMRALEMYGKYVAAVIVMGLVLALAVWLFASLRQWWNDR
jgi:hypothetical protein